MKYLLVANAVIALLNDTNSVTAQRARRHKPQDVGMSAIVFHHQAHRDQQRDLPAPREPQNFCGRAGRTAQVLGTT